MMSSSSDKKYTVKQLRFIEYLIDQLGYRNSIHRSEYRELILRRCFSVENTSEVIDKLLRDVQLRRNAERKIVHNNYTIVSDLSEFTFCPASFSIKNTFIVPKEPEEELGSEYHKKYYVEQFITALIKKKVTYAKIMKIQGIGGLVRNIDYGDLLESDIIYRGHDENSLPFTSKKGNLRGSPDYIFKHPNDYCIVVEEKHTWQEEIKNPWNSDVVQLLGYLYGIHEYPIRHGYIFYFPWKWDNSRRKEKDPKIYKVQKDDTNKRLISNKFEELSQFKSTGEAFFNNDQINTLKCYKCSSNAFCNHKSGFRDKLRYPYI